MEIILVRHTSVDVEPGTCYGWSDVNVAATFESEAQATLERIKQYKPFDAVFSSPLKRATMLAAYCGYNEPIIDNRLKEMNMGEWEMRRYDDITDPVIEQWYKDYFNTRLPKGESFMMLYDRIADFLTWLKEQNRYKKVAVFAHAGPLMCAAIYSGLYTKEEALAHLPAYGRHISIQI